VKEIILKKVAILTKFQKKVVRNKFLVDLVLTVIVVSLFKGKNLRSVQDDSTGAIIRFGLQRYSILKRAGLASLPT